MIRYFALLCLIGCALEAGAQCLPACAQPVKRQYSYAVEILDVKPLGAAIVEHEPIQVSYRLTISSFGIVGDLPPLRDLRVCPRLKAPSTNCVAIPNPRLRRKYEGKIQALAPAAGTASPVIIAVSQRVLPPLGTWPEVADARKYVSVAARYEISIDSFETLHTRSARTDTAFINLQGMVKSQPPHLSDNEDACRLVGFNWCKMNVKYGDVQDGLHLVNNVRVGPYLLIPEVEMNLRFLFTVYNFGDSYTARLGEAIANGFSTAGMIFLKGADTTGSDAAESLDEAMKALHAAAFAGCDGYMAVDTVVLVNQTVPEQPDATLDALTRATGVYRPAATKIYEGGQYADGNTRCGAGGRYKVTYAVHRTSWRQQ